MIAVPYSLSLIHPPRTLCIFLGFLRHAPLRSSFCPRGLFFRRQLAPPFPCPSPAHFLELLRHLNTKGFSHRRRPLSQFLRQTADALHQKLFASQTKFIRIICEIPIKGFRQIEPRRNSKVVHFGLVSPGLFLHAVLEAAAFLFFPAIHLTAEELAQHRARTHGN
jgi:hypothetical protein